MPSDSIHPFFLRHPVSAGTHLLFCVWAMYATALWRRRFHADRLRRASVTVFGLSMVLLYGASGLYHAIPADHPRLIALFLRLDLSAIFLLIAGTCTPVFAVLLTGRRRLVLLALIWTLALAGTATKWFLPFPPYPLTVGLYVAAGAAGFLPAFLLTRTVVRSGLGLLLLGAAVYAAGAACDSVRWPVPLPGVIGHHEILHLCDMVGTTCHLTFIVCHVLPWPGPA